MGVARRGSLKPNLEFPMNDEILDRLQDIYEKLDNIEQRVARTETRLCKLMESVGVAPSASAPVTRQLAMLRHYERGQSYGRQP
jgi:hypothetical protein